MIRAGSVVINVGNKGGRSRVYKNKSLILSVAAAASSFHARTGSSIDYGANRVAEAGGIMSELGFL